MSVSSLGLYRADGRLRGSWVYMLVCRDGDGPIYVKVGITDCLDRRLLALRLGCPVTPRHFYSMEVMSRRKAMSVERGLHKAFNPWAAHGEWFRVPLADKEPFNEAWKPVLARHAVTGWPARWEKVAVQPLIEAKRRASRMKLKYLRRRGRAYQDFERDARA